MGSLANPDWYYEIKYQQVEAMKEAYKVIKSCDEILRKSLGRFYSPIETYMIEDAEIAILTYGGIYGSLLEAIDKLRNEGYKVGAIRLRLWRPFPIEDILNATKDLSMLIIIDRAISYGASIAGPVALETIAAIHQKGENLDVVNYIAGIGGRPVTEIDFEKMFKLTLKLGRKAREMGTLYWGVRGVKYE
jgi:pyruvate ferredoxin oxidoreductase alpha subunit